MDNPRAFPSPIFECEDGYETFLPGMTLRDYFAAAALPGLTANRSHLDILDDADALVIAAYTMADKMLEKRDE